MTISVSSLRRLAAFCLSLAGSTAMGATIHAEVLDASGQPVADAAVYAEPLFGQVLPKPQRVVEIEQKGKAFLPLVTVVQAGTEIAFPNNDTVRHHVYSFSPAKIFELKLYSGTPANTVPFDKPGTVVLGCNIHDRMVAYIHVGNTPYFGKTDKAGKLSLDRLSAGKYRLKAWHYNLPAGASIPAQEITLAASAAEDARFKLNLKTDGAAH